MFHRCFKVGNLWFWYDFDMFLSYPIQVLLNRIGCASSFRWSMMKCETRPDIACDGGHCHNRHFFCSSWRPSNQQAKRWQTKAENCLPISIDFMQIPMSSNIHDMISNYIKRLDFNFKIPVKFPQSIRLLVDLPNSFPGIKLPVFSSIGDGLWPKDAKQCKCPTSW